MKSLNRIERTLQSKNFLVSILNKNFKNNYLKTDLIKNTFILSFILIVGVILIFTCYYGYSGENSKYIVNDLVNNPKEPITESSANNWANLKGMPINVRVTRAVFDLSIVWFIFFYLYGLKIGIIYWKRRSKKYYSLLFFFSFILLIDIIFLFFNLIKNFDKYIIKTQIKYFFRKEDYLVHQFRIWTIKRKLLFLQWVIYLPLLPSLFYCSEPTYNNWDTNFWFFTVSFFTLEGNLLVFLFLTLIVFFPGWQIFKNNLFQIMVTCYITIVTSIWCIILLPNFIVTNTFPTNKISQFFTIWIHIITPWSFIPLSIYLIKTTRKQNYDNLTKAIVICAIYPLMYSLYIAILPFNTGISIYSWVTNLNPNLAIFVSYKNPKNRNYGNPIYVLWFILANIIFSITTFFYAYISKNTLEKMGSFPKDELKLLDPKPKNNFVSNQ